MINGYTFANRDLWDDVTPVYYRQHGLGEIVTVICRAGLSRLSCTSLAVLRTTSSSMNPRTRSGWSRAIATLSLYRVSSPCGP